MTDLETVKAKLALIRALGGAPSDHPRGVIIMGQNSSGKTLLQKIILKALGPEFAYYDCDDNSAFHPETLLLLRPDGIRYKRAILDGTAFLHDAAMGYITEQGLSVITGHPLDRIQFANGWLDAFRDSPKDYHISLVILAVHESDSLLGAVDRLVSGGSHRSSPVHFPKDGLHDLQYERLPGVVRALEANGRVDSLYVVDRDYTLLHQNHLGPDWTMRGPLGAAAALEAGRNQPKTEAQIADFNEKIAKSRANAPAWAQRFVDEAERRHDAHLRRTGVRRASGLVVPTGLTITDALRAFGPARKGHPESVRRPMSDHMTSAPNRAAR